MIYGNHIKANHKCVVVNVYAACNPRDKKTLWAKLSNIKAISQDVVWCLCGDFNTTRSHRERKGRTGRENHASEIKGFNNFIDANLFCLIFLLWVKSSRGLLLMG